MKKTIVAYMLVAAALQASAQVKTVVSEFRQAGPFAVSKPFAVDTVDVQGRKFDDNALLNSISLLAPATQTFTGTVLPSLSDSRSVGMLTFYLNNSSYLKGRINVKGPKNYRLFVDGKEAGADLKLAPEHHTFSIKYLAEPNDTDSIHVTIDTPLSIIH